MKRLYAMMQAAGACGLFVVAGASDAGRLGLGETAAAVACCALPMLAGLAGSHLLARAQPKPAPAPQAQPCVTAPPEDAA